MMRGPWWPAPPGPSSLLGALVLAFLLVQAPVAGASPVIDHDLPTVEINKPLVFTAHVTSAGGILAVYLCYKTTTQDFVVVPMAPPVPLKSAASDTDTKPTGPILSQNFEAHIPVDELIGKSVQYFLVAYDATDLSPGYWHSREDPEFVMLPVTAKPDAGDSDDLTVEDPEEKVTKIVHDQRRDPSNPDYDGNVPPPYTLPAGAGYLRIVTEPPSAQITMSGDALGPSPVDRVAPVGTYSVTARLPGYRDLKRNVGVQPGKGRQLVLRLHKR